MFGDTEPEIQSDPTSSLLSILEKFNTTRHHMTNPIEKQKAHDYIIESFRNYHLHVWTERAKIGDVSEYIYVY